MELWERNCPIILSKFRLPPKFRYLLHAANLRHGTDIYIYIHTHKTVVFCCCAVVGINFVNWFSARKVANSKSAFFLIVLNKIEHN